MIKKMVVSTGEGYGDSKYIFDDEQDAIQFFQLIGKANPVGSDYVTGMGSIYYEAAISRNSISASYQMIHSPTEVKVIKDNEEANRLFDLAKKEEAEPEGV